MTTRHQGISSYRSNKADGICLRHRKNGHWTLLPGGVYFNAQLKAWRIYEDYKYCRMGGFPTSHFRIAYDLLREQNHLHADKEYLQILYCAARESEEAVNSALQKIISEGSTLTAASVAVLVKWLEDNGIPQVTDTFVAEVNLNQYDNLLSIERRIAV
jgi:hypothetical protein